MAALFSPAGYTPLSKVHRAAQKLSEYSLQSFLAQVEQSATIYVDGGEANPFELDEMVLVINNGRAVFIDTETWTISGSYLASVAHVVRSEAYEEAQAEALADGRLSRFPGGFQSFDLGQFERLGLTDEELSHINRMFAPEPPLERLKSLSDPDSPLREVPSGLPEMLSRFEGMPIIIKKDEARALLEGYVPSEGKGTNHTATTKVEMPTAELERAFSKFMASFQEGDWPSATQRNEWCAEMGITRVRGDALWEKFKGPHMSAAGRRKRLPRNSS